MDKRFYWNFSVYLGRKVAADDIKNQLSLMIKFFENKNSLRLYAKEGLPYMFFRVEMMKPQTFTQAKGLASYGSLGRLAAATCMDLMITHFNMSRFTPTREFGKFDVEDAEGHRAIQTMHIV